MGKEVLVGLLESTRRYLSDIKPSDWYEQNMVMPPSSAFPGKFSFDQTPFWREPLDCLAKSHPAVWVTIMKSAQIGGSAAVLNPIVGYVISQTPGNMMFLTGHSELSDRAFLKIDKVIDQCGLRELIGPTTQRAKSSRTGDTSKMKEFPGGSLIGGSVTNHNLLRQDDIQYMIVDDFDAAPMASKAAGSTRALVDQRTAAFARKKKIYYVSSPQLKNSSNIDSVFLQGDQRYFHVPCPICAVRIPLKWKVNLPDNETAGITWKTDNHGHLDRTSVGYICQECGGFFTDQQKYEMNLAGVWVPSVIPKEENHYSYQISALYAPTFMDNWATLVQKYITAEAKKDDKDMQTFVNVNLGETYEKIGIEIEKDAVQKNTRNYDVGIVPVWRSRKDGNEKIIMITCACDLNGKEKDARMDYEVVGWSESGSSYSIIHGSIGTFRSRETEEQKKEDRVKWTYEHNKPNSVWPEFEKVLKTKFKTDVDTVMSILYTGIDCGHFTNHAYTFIDHTNFNVIGVKGNKESEYRKYGVDLPDFKPARERKKLFLLDVNHIKDQVAKNIELNWSSGEVQPPGFLNFPTPSGGLYTYNGFFKHYSSEARTEETKEGEGIASRWVKINQADQNHFWDVYIYNYALKEIWAQNVLSLAKPAMKGNWTDYVAYAKMMKII